jgi:hypothetical protein
MWLAMLLWAAAVMKLSAAAAERVVEANLVAKLQRAAARSRPVRL